MSGRQINFNHYFLNIEAAFFEKLPKLNVGGGLLDMYKKINDSLILSN